MSSTRLRSLFFSYEEDIRNGLKQITKGSKQSEEALKKLLGYFLYCLQPAVRTKIQVFSLDGEHDLDDTIFQAIIQGSFVRSRFIRLDDLISLLF